MGEGAAGKVFIAVDLSYEYWGDIVADELPQPQWFGHREWDDGTPPEEGPTFADASDAVRWWRNRGATWIAIRLDDSGYLWAGVGAPPSSLSPMPLFSDDDPRGRPEGALASAKAARKLWREQLPGQIEAHRKHRATEAGDQLRKRREAVNLSVEELAARVQVAPAWIEDIESGQTSLQISLRQWVELVWATREPWPDEHRFRSHGPIGWAGPESLSTAEQIVLAILGEGQE